MAQARHIGKVVVIAAPGVGPVRPQCRAPLAGAGGRARISSPVASGASGSRWRGGWPSGRPRTRPDGPAARPTPASRSPRSSELRADRRARCVAVAADVCDREDALAGCCATVRRDRPPLRGVVHAAGVLGDGVLLQQRWSRFARVLAPKVTGAWHLHALTRDEPLDFFVALLLGGLAAGLAGPGQPRRGQRLPRRAGAPPPGPRACRRCSINWGAWAEVGAAAREDVERRIARLQGVGSHHAGRGHRRAASARSAGGDAQLGVHADRLGAFLGQSRRAAPASLSELARRAPDAKRRPPPRRTPAPRAGAAPQSSRPPTATAGAELLAAHVARAGDDACSASTAAARIDHAPPLHELGLDSLMAVELRNLLQARPGPGRSAAGDAGLRPPDGRGHRPSTSADEVLGLAGDRTSSRATRRDPARASGDAARPDRAASRTTRSTGSSPSACGSAAAMSRLPRADREAVAQAAGPAAVGAARTRLERVERARAEPDRRRRHGLPLPGRRRPIPERVLAPARTTASTPITAVPPDRWDVEALLRPRSRTRPARCRPASGGFLAERRPLRRRVLRHLAARGA